MLCRDQGSSGPQIAEAMGWVLGLRRHRDAGVSRSDTDDTRVADTP
jgi:hypothetical protein